MRRNSITKTDAMECQFYVKDTILTIGMFRVIVDRSNLALLVFEKKAQSRFFTYKYGLPFFLAIKKLLLLLSNTDVF